MSYIYDILLNLNNVILDFYDWNEDDKVVHIKKAPIFLVNTKFINDLTYNKLKISQSLMSKIYNKTRYYCDMHPLCCLKGGIYHLSELWGLPRRRSVFFYI